MKLLMTTDTLGGVWTYSLELVKQLATYDVNVTLAAMGAPLTSDQQRQVEALENADIHVNPFRLEWMPAPWDDVRAAGEWLMSISDAVQPDLVHLNDYSYGVLNWKAPVLMVGHSCVSSWMWHVRGRLPGAEWDEYCRRVCNGLHAADLIVAPSWGMLRDLVRFYGHFPATKVIYNGRSLCTRALQEREPFILCAGRLWDEAKNISLLAEIADEVAWPIYIAGSERAPDGTGKTNRESLRPLGPLSQRELQNWMARASLYVLPAKYEPFGLTALEAARCGCPLVLSDIETLREVWGDSAVFLPPDNPVQWTDSLNSLIADARFRKEMAQRAEARSQRYSAERMAADYFACYTGLIESSQMPELIKGQR